MTTLTDRLRYEARSRILDSRRLGLRYLENRKGYADRRLQPATQIVIDGFPRSANSYARWAFCYAQGDADLLAGHAHSSALLRESARRGLPTVLIIREPAATVGSLVQMGGGHDIGLRAGLHGYRRFHERLLPALDDIHVATFEEVTEDFGSVVSAINDRFGTTFATYAGTPDDERAVRHLLEEANRRHNDGVLSERSVSRPSESRVPGSQLVSESDASTQRALSRASAVYDAIVGHRRRLPRRSLPR